MKFALLVVVVFFVTKVGFLYGNTIEDDPRELYPRRQVISFLPLYMAVNSIRIDYDLAFTPKHWIQVAPALYLRNNTLSEFADDFDFKRLRGAGIHVYHRFYPAGNYFDRYSIYISYGAIYQNLHFTYNQWVNDLSVEKYSHIQRVGGDVIIGIVVPVIDPLLFDFYAGMGLRHTILKSNADRPRKFNDFLGDYGYAGNILILGLRLSVPF